MDCKEALLWYSRLPRTVVATPILSYLHRQMLNIFAEHEHWTDLDDSANRIMSRGLTDNYEVALGMALSGFDDELD